MQSTEDSAGKCERDAMLCGNCRKALQRPMVCAGCKAATYCSKDCQVRLGLWHMPPVYASTHARTQMPHWTPPNLHPSFCGCQIKAWKAGHKGECASHQERDIWGVRAGAAAADLSTTRTAAALTAGQWRVLRQLEEHAAAADWRGVAALESAGKEVAAAVRAAMPGRAAYVSNVLGIAYGSLGDFVKASEHVTQHLAIAKEMGDRAGEGRACNNLGNVYCSLGDYSKSIEYHTRYLTFAKEMRDRAGQGTALGGIGNAYTHLGDYGKAIAHHTQCLAIAKEVGDRAMEGRAYGNLGSAHLSQGDVDKSVEYHTQQLKLAKKVGDRDGEGRACGNLGNAYGSQGDFGKAIKYQTKRLAIAKEVGDRAGEGAAYANLGNCHTHLNENDKAVAYHEAHLALAKELYNPHMQAHAELGLGVALRFRVRADRRGHGEGGREREGGRGPAAGASQGSGPQSDTSHSDTSVSALQSLGRGFLVRSLPVAGDAADACLDDKVREAAKWLKSAHNGGRAFAQMHLAHLYFDAGQQDAALAHLKAHLTWRVQAGRGTCDGCGQTRVEDTPMLTCGGCRVARFCSADHQKLASRRAALGGNMLLGRHKDICGVLKKWREVVKDGVAPDSCTADLVAFVQR